MAEEMGIGRHRGKNLNMDFYERGNSYRNLWSAVILGALEDIEVPQMVEYKGRSKSAQKKKMWDKRQKRIVERKLKVRSLWFFESPHSSLEWACSVLGLNLVAVRKAAEDIYCGKRTLKEFDLNKEIVEEEESDIDTEVDVFSTGIEQADNLCDLNLVNTQLLIEHTGAPIQPVIKRKV